MCQHFKCFLLICEWDCAFFLLLFLCAHYAFSSEIIIELYYLWKLFKSMLSFQFIGLFPWLPLSHTIFFIFSIRYIYIKMKTQQFTPLACLWPIFFHPIGFSIHWNVHRLTITILLSLLFCYCSIEHNIKVVECTFSSA